MNRRSLVFWGVLLVLLLGIGAMSGRQATVGEPLDPDATDQMGTAALLVLAQEFGGSVERGLPTAETGTALVLADRLDDRQRDQLDQWIEAGGTLVVTDPDSPFTPGLDPFDPGVRYDELGSQTCTVDGLEGLRLEAGSFFLYPSSSPEPDATESDLTEPDPTEPDPTEPETTEPERTAEAVTGRCFSSAEGSYLVVTERGAGQVIALGGALPLTNQYLDQGDNAVLAVELLLGSDAAGSGSQQVAVLFEPIFDPGSKTLSDLIPTGAKWAAWELLAACVLFILWRARRFGQPVSEAQPVELPGSLLVRATGELRRRSGGHAEASCLLRADLEQRLRRRLTVSPDVPVADVATQAAVVGGIDRKVVERALSGSPSGTAAELATLVADIDLVNGAVLAPQPLSPPATLAAPATVGTAGELM
jgi:hypothetical protein